MCDPTTPMHQFIGLQQSSVNPLFLSNLSYSERPFSTIKDRLQLCLLLLVMSQWCVMRYKRLDEGAAELMLLFPKNSAHFLSVLLVSLRSFQSVGIPLLQYRSAPPPVVCFITPHRFETTQLHSCCLYIVFIAVW